MGQDLGRADVRSTYFIREVARTGLVDVSDVHQRAFSVQAPGKRGADVPGALDKHSDTGGQDRIEADLCCAADRRLNTGCSPG